MIVLVDVQSGARHMLQLALALAIDATDEGGVLRGDVDGVFHQRACPGRARARTNRGAGAGEGAVLPRIAPAKDIRVWMINTVARGAVRLMSSFRACGRPLEHVFAGSTGPWWELTQPSERRLGRR